MNRGTRGGPAPAPWLVTLLFSLRALWPPRPSCLRTVHVTFTPNPSSLCRQHEQEWTRGQGLHLSRGYRGTWAPGWHSLGPSRPLLPWGGVRLEWDGVHSPRQRPLRPRSEDTAGWDGRSFRAMRGPTQCHCFCSLPPSPSPGLQECEVQLREAVVPLLWHLDGLDSTAHRHPKFSRALLQSTPAPVLLRLPPLLSGSSKTLQLLHQDLPSQPSSSNPLLLLNQLLFPSQNLHLGGQTPRKH